MISGERLDEIVRLVTDDGEPVEGVGRFALAGAIFDLLADRDRPGENKTYRAALEKATWDLATYTFRGKDISLGEEAERLLGAYLSIPAFSDSKEGQ